MSEHTAGFAELLEVARRYEAWEGKLILSEEAWRGGVAELPTLTDELWDDLLEIQGLRNAAIAKATGRSG